MQQIVSQPAVSVIVPAYQAQRHLPRALRSLLAQTLQEVEIIVVDDGSTDRSYNIALEFQALHPAIRLHRQRNAGPAAARNTGLALARGRYIGFVDADDWAEPTLYASLYAACEESGAELACCGYYRDGMRSKAVTACAPEDRIWSGQECRAMLPFLINENAGHLSLWNKLIRRDFLDTYGLCLPEALACGEDAVFISQCLLRCSQLVTVSRPLYHFVPRPHCASALPQAPAQRLAQYNAFTALLQSSDIPQACRAFSAGWLRLLPALCAEEYRRSASEAAFYEAMISLAEAPQVQEALANADPSTLPKAALACYHAVLSKDWPRLRKQSRRQTMVNAVEHQAQHALYYAKLCVACLTQHRAAPMPSAD